jgi:hypothetical protein
MLCYTAAPCQSGLLFPEGTHAAAVGMHVGSSVEKEQVFQSRRRHRPKKPLEEMKKLMKK